MVVVSNDDQPAFLNVGLWSLDGAVCDDGESWLIAGINGFEDSEGPIVDQPDLLKPPRECTDP